MVGHVGPIERDVEEPRLRHRVGEVGGEVDGASGRVDVAEEQLAVEVLFPEEVAGSVRRSFDDSF